MKKLIIFGTGGHAKACIDVIEEEKKYKIMGFIEKNKSNENRFMNYPILGQDKDLKKFKEKNLNILIAIARLRLWSIKINLYNKLTTLGYNFPTIISPRSYVSKKAKIGKGTIILHDVIINSSAKIGNNCIINSKSLIEHSSVIRNHSQISTGVIINGDCEIGSNTFVGSGSIIKEATKIGNNCIVGMGQAIKKNLTDNKIIK